MNFINILRKLQTLLEKEWERYGGKGKGRKETVERNVIHSGLYEINK